MSDRHGLLRLGSPSPDGCGLPRRIIGIALLRTAEAVLFHAAWREHERASAEAVLFYAAGRLYR
ncbi:MAG TPA: hypothetical protein VFR24_13745 [Candidatus Angelobacter sp.]|nr:hypothetical protein [Candidatus Angelobacter sp.]